MNSADITFVVITRNEAAKIAACLRSLPPNVPILVYDSISDDETVEFARSFGATVIQAQWAGYARAREDAAAEVRTPWTFMLDADERLTPALAQELEDLQPPDDVAGYSVPRRNHFCGRWIRSAGWWPDRLVRLFRTGKVTITSRGSVDSSVHEAWQVQGLCVDLRAPIDHFSYESIEDYGRKFALYTSLEAAGTQVGLGRLITAWLVMPLRAGWYLVGRGGVLEGWRGVYVCMGSALYPAVVATKSWRRTRRSSPQATS